MYTRVDYGHKIYRITSLSIITMVTYCIYILYRIVIKIRCLAYVADTIRSATVKQSTHIIQNKQYNTISLFLQYLKIVCKDIF